MRVGSDALCNCHAMSFRGLAFQSFRVFSRLARQTVIQETFAFRTEALPTRQSVFATEIGARLACRVLQQDFRDLLFRQLCLLLRPISSSAGASSRVEAKSHSRARVAESFIDAAPRCLDFRYIPEIMILSCTGGGYVRDIA